MAGNSAAYADRILTHYITLALRKIDGSVDRDTYAELDGLIQAAIEEAVKPLNERIAKLERRLDDAERVAYAAAAGESLI